MAERKIVRLETSALVVPAEVETDGAYLYWSMRKWAESGRTRLAQPSRTMLDRFVALAGAKPETICAFSRKYGVLGICAQHKMPSSITFRSKRRNVPSTSISAREINTFENIPEERAGRFGDWK